MAIPQDKPVAARPKQSRRKRRRVWKDKHFRWVPDGQGDWRVQTYLFRHRHKPKKGHARGPGKKPARQALAAAPTAARHRRPSTRARPAPTRGPSGPRRQCGCCNRAGFGPVPGQAEQLASLGLVGAVQSLTRPSGLGRPHRPRPASTTTATRSPRPTPGDTTTSGGSTAWFAPTSRWSSGWPSSSTTGSRPRTGTSPKPQQMIDQSNLFRSRCFGSFLDLFKAVTIDPAMLQWLNGNENNKWAPNENYAREMMELFSLGADRGAYTEEDIREAARALTGWRNDWSSELGAHNFRFDSKRHDTSAKTVFGQTGNWGWEDACRLCVEHPLHASFFVEKLWSYFVPAPPPSGVRDQLIQTYVGSGWQIRPVLEAILTSPEFYEGPPMVKPPVVHLASMLRALGRGIDTEAWIWLCDMAGQLLFWPPNVSGWDDDRWLDTSTMRARWNYRHLRAGGDRAGRLERRPTAPPRPPRKRSPGRSPPGARRRCATSTAPSCSNFARAQREPDRRQLAERPLPGDAPERPPAADRRQPGPDPAMSPRPQSHTCCSDYTRSQLLRSAAAEAGKGLPAIEPGMPEPAGTGLSRRTLPLPQRRAGAGRLRRLEDPALGLRDRDRPGGADRQDPRLGLLRRRHRLAERAGAGRRRALPAAAAEPGTGARSRHRLQRGPEPAVAPRRGGAGDAARRGQGQRLPGDRLRPPRPVPLHLAPLLRDRRARRSATGPAGWAATSTRSATTRTRCRGSRSTARSRR